MAYLRKLISLLIALVLVAAPLSAAHAQTLYPYGYSGYNGYSGYMGTGGNRNYMYRSYPYYNPQPYYPRPTCTISITTPTNYSGGYGVSATVSWRSVNASYAYLSSYGSVYPWGGITVFAYPYQTFVLTVVGQGGTSTCQVQYVPSPYYYYPYY